MHRDELVALLKARGSVRLDSKDFQGSVNDCSEAIELMKRYMITHIYMYYFCKYTYMCIYMSIYMHDMYTYMHIYEVLMTVARR
jgi:hypothetical protein